MKRKYISVGERKVLFDCIDDFQREIKQLQKYIDDAKDVQIRRVYSIDDCIKIRHALRNYALIFGSTDALHALYTLNDIVDRIKK